MHAIVATVNIDVSRSSRAITELNDIVVPGAKVNGSFSPSLVGAGLPHLHWWSGTPRSYGVATRSGAVCNLWRRTRQEDGIGTYSPRQLHTRIDRDR